MAHTNIDIDDELCDRVMDRYHLTTKREAVNLALRHLAVGRSGCQRHVRCGRAAGKGDIDEMRTSRV